MRVSTAIASIGVILAVSVTPASAQRRRAPSEGMLAAGVSSGMSVPTDDRLESGLGLAGHVEGYVSPRVSIRGLLGGTWQDFERQRFTGSVKPLFVNGNVVYNWERGKWHPYVTGGIGVYRYGYNENGIKGSDTAFGVNGGSGIEYFFLRDAAVTGEVLYHRIGDVTTALAPFDDPSFWTLGIGLKKYF